MKAGPHASFSLEGKIALVTGGTTGIGRAIAEGFAAEGAQVWIHARSRTEVDSQETFPGVRIVTADFARPKEIERLVRELRAKTPRLDILVNNAGIEKRMRFSRLREKVLAETMQVNAFAPAQLTYGLLPLLKASAGASIINLTSIHDNVPYPGNAAYSMSKAALAMLTKTLAVELAPLGIRANNLAPGAIETDINRHVIEAIGRKKFAAWIPAGRVGAAEEMVGPAIFLASDASSYCTGATIYADGAYMHHVVRYAVE